MPELLRTSRFLPLFVTQFLGAFNDNVFKNALVVLITYRAGVENPQILVTLAAGLFILPYLLFSATAGQMADAIDRARMARGVKVAEIVIMCVAAAGFMTNSIYFLLFVLFCLGVQATFFGPIKYALLPQHLRENELIAGNGYIEAGTFLAILFGTIAGGLLILHETGREIISAAMVAIALGGYASSRAIPEAPAPTPGLKLNFNIAQETWKILMHDRNHRRVWLSILGISWFWLVGATFLSQFPTFAKVNLQADETVVTFFLTVFSVGIGIGSLLCNRLLGGEISSVYVPWAALGLGLFTVDLYFASGAVSTAEGLMDVWSFLGRTAGLRIAFDLLMIAICAGIYIVPLYAIMQHESEASHRARTIASNNVMNALFMVLSAVATVAMLQASFSVPQVFLTMAVLNVAAAGVIWDLRKPASPRA